MDEICDKMNRVADAAKLKIDDLVQVSMLFNLFPLSLKLF
jgi:hypothetical protein